MRTEIEIKTELDSQLAEYRTNVDTWTRSEIEASNAKVKALQEELNNLYIEGAVIPESIKQYVLGGLFGMKRGSGQYEVGCSIKVQKLGKEVIQGLCSRGGTIQEAVSNWNNGIYA